MGIYFKKHTPKVESICLPLKPRFILDPIKLTKGHHTHRSWVDFENLAGQLEDCQIVNISDTYYFYCGQCAQLVKKLKKKLVTIIWENTPHHPGTFLPPYALNVGKVVKNNF